MFYLLVKAVVSGLLIAIISEVSRRAPGWGGLIASLPLVSVLALIWLWRADGVVPTPWDLVGGGICLVGMAIIALQPRTTS